ncbi:H+transporting two-sector ATPase C subunit [Methanothermus fervidus DSM 2088]|uniref:H+transporting two-sector ATPase C subunit n=1 Tax=Methanothermus fervidus (strain ATCC 43054 / DSM 2088 / JCM 10308 / V24 S) TaxID=523846 RepID=E3GWF0_METFV|nr:hypothetical protein [Methanothermus fervidus]ADP77915.1 H+transporting two-sector ATPase C subunit [Methanothermus fervidus DSM 2088]
MPKATLATGIIAIGAGLAIGFAGLGAGVGQGVVGSSSVGAIVEDPGSFGKSLLFTALPETHTIFGFIIAIMLIMFSGMMGG